MTKYTPKFEDTSLPEDDEDYLEDGSPRFIAVGFRDWKSRAKKCKRKKQVFRIRLYGNPKCLLYCPVHWLLKHWSDRDKLEGPILEKVTGDTFQSQQTILRGPGLRTILGTACVKLQCSRHIDVAWADLFVIKNVGYWCSLDRAVLPRCN